MYARSVPVGVPLDKGDPATVDDRDGVNEEEEYENWKLRELRRLQRHAEEQAAYATRFLSFLRAHAPPAFASSSLFFDRGTGWRRIGPTLSGGAT